MPLYGNDVIKKIEAQNLQQTAVELVNGVVPEAVGNPVPVNSKLNRRKFIKASTLAAVFGFMLSGKIAQAAKLVSNETEPALRPAAGNLPGIPLKKTSYKEWMKDVLEAAGKLHKFYSAQLKKLGPKPHAGEVNTPRQIIEQKLSLLGQVIKTASLEDSSVIASPEGKFSTLASTQGRGLYALAAALKKFKGLKDTIFSDLIEKSDRLFGLTSIDDFDPNKRTVVIFGPAAGDPRWRSENLVNNYPKEQEKSIQKACVNLSCLLANGSFGLNASAS